MNVEQKISRVAAMVDDCLDHLATQEVSRARALNYYNGVMDDVPARKNHSSITSRDVRAAVHKIMPSIMRSFMGSGKIVEYHPVGQEDEPFATQATAYVNNVVVQECDAERALHDAFQDAMLVKTGILKWAAYTREKAVIHEFADVPDSEFVGLDDDPEITILDHKKTPETDEYELSLDPNARRHTFKVRQLEAKTEIKLEAIPRGSFLIYPSALSIVDSPIVGERQRVSRSELVSLGYDRDKVAALSSDDDDDDDDDDEARQGEDHASNPDSTPAESQVVTIFEVYVRLDLDDDGIAEMYRVVYGEGGNSSEGSGGQIVLEHSPVDAAPYASVVAERDAHQFEGRSIAEDVEDIQQLKTSILRSTLDNITKQNNAVAAIDLSVVENPDAITNPRPNYPLLLKRGADARSALQYSAVPNIAPDTFGMLGYFDNEAKDRTGITDASGGLNPEAFQSMTATTAQIMSESGIAQSEMIIRSLSKGVRAAFRGILKLVIAHQGERNIRLGGEWASYDPSQWNDKMDCTVNVGLGAGSRERDMSVLNVIMNLQREIMGAIGAQNPLVKPEQLYNTLEKITEAAGLPSADPFFTKPDPAEVQALIAQRANQPNPQEQKVKAQIALEKEKAKASQVKEAAQMQADLQVEEAKRESQLQIAALEAQIEYLMHTDKMKLEAAKAGLIVPDIQRPMVPELINGR